MPCTYSAMLLYSSVWTYIPNCLDGNILGKMYILLFCYSVILLIRVSFNKILFRNYFNRLYSSCGNYMKYNIAI